MKVCLVASFPPSVRQLNEYSYHLARELGQQQGIELTVLADELEEYNFVTDGRGQRAAVQYPELAGVTVIRCWRFGSLGTPARLLKMIREVSPDVVWFNLVFSSFGAMKSPFAAFAGLSVPAFTRAAGFYTHVTLHHIMEHVDLAGAGAGRSREKIYRTGAAMATRALLKANTVSVLLSSYRRTLASKYSAENVLVGTHGTFAAAPSTPDFTVRGNPEHRILAFGNWGTYKRLEGLMEAFPSILARIPNARLIVAGGNHPAAAGYWESIRAAQPAGLPIEFRGYIPQEDVPELFRTSTLLVMPYDSSTGSSGPAHQACEYGLPIVCADIEDFRCMAADDDMAISFYGAGDSADLAEKLIEVLESPNQQRQMSMHNYAAGVQMTMEAVVRNYLRWFELHRFKRTIGNEGLLARLSRHLSAWPSRLTESVASWKQAIGLLPTRAEGGPDLESAEIGMVEILSHAPGRSSGLRHQAHAEWNETNPELEKAG